MFPRSSEDELGNGFLRSGRRFRSGKRRKVIGGRRAYSFPREDEYGCESYLDEGSYDEEEEYSPVSENAESVGSIELPRIGRDYSIPERSPRARPRSPSPEPLVNTSSPSVGTGEQEIPSSIPINLINSGGLANNPSTTLMAGTYIRLPTFNGNGREDPKKHWFLCEVVWMVRFVHNADIKKGQMIMTLRGHALD